ncbi:MAG TPA: Gfo/Idh/MocA family oxidoreductase [Caulobacterales bacterium]|nr:Gfo/Idh/MocA family oxidoreductase [Caulobacterales bacterium]
MSLRIGILGTARIARSFCEGLRGSEKVEVAAIASRRQDSADAFAREMGIGKAYASYDALLADDTIAAIYNPLPHGLHRQWCVRAASARKHVLCEKPFGLNADDVLAIQAAARANGVHIVEAYPYLAQPQTQKLRALVREGAIGKLRLIVGTFSFNLTKPDDIRLDPALGAGALYDVGCYVVSFTRVLAGARPVRVSAAADFYARGGDRTLAATLEHGDGLLAQISCSFATQHTRYALIMGEDGVIETNFWNHTNAKFPALLRIKRGNLPHEWETLTAPETNGFRAEAESFADLIAGGEWSGATAQESLDIAQALDGIRESAEKRAPVQLP